jgi:hypothetical protein
MLRKPSPPIDNTTVVGLKTVENMWGFSWSSFNFVCIYVYKILYYVIVYINLLHNLIYF